MDNMTNLTPPTDEPTITPAEEVLATPTPSPAEATPPADPADIAPNEAPPEVDYDALAAADLEELRRCVPSLADIQHISEIPGAMRYAELRDMGLGVEEAFWAACHKSVTPKKPSYDNRSHLHSAVPRGAAGNPAMMTASELAAARDLFGDLSDSEIQKLYARCR